MRIQDWTQLVL